MEITEHKSVKSLGEYFENFQVTHDIYFLQQIWKNPQIKESSRSNMSQLCSFVHYFGLSTKLFIYEVDNKIKNLDEKRVLNIGVYKNALWRQQQKPYH